jgi:hypothetical protein
MGLVRTGRVWISRKVRSVYILPTDGGGGPAPRVGDVGWARCSQSWWIEVKPCIPCGVTALGDVMCAC